MMFFYECDTFLLRTATRYYILVFSFFLLNCLVVKMLVGWGHALILWFYIWVYKNICLYICIYF